MMKFESISTQTVAGLPPISPNDARRINIFETLSIEGCLLDCDVWKARQATADRRTTTKDQKQDKGTELKELAKLAIKKHRQPQNSAKRVPRSVLKSNRGPFKLRDLEASSQSGCQCCRFFHGLFIALLSAHSTLAIEDLVFEWVRYQFLVTIQDEKKREIFSYQFFSPRGAEMIIQRSQTSAMLLGDTSSDLSLAKADEWIQECKSSHKQCGIGIDVPLPKRCLYLGPIEDTNFTGIRLAETEGIFGTYACLSHCWGNGPKPIETETKTLPDHLNSISWSELPKTFQDAVVIARKLRIRYLWIDSLCIIQDSELDWQVESSKMANIYQNSFVTIAAVSSSDSRGGCFSPEKIADIFFQVKGDGGIDTILGARYCEAAGPATDFDEFAGALPLLTRGWVYQERMLSRRILYCNHREFQFECREIDTCECGSRSVPPHTVARSHASQGLMHGKRQYAQLEKFKGNPEAGKFSQMQVVQHWQKIVGQYTKLKLTYGTDMLPALSGCAKDINRFRDDAYLAGLWRSNMAGGMLWMVKAPVEKPRPEKPRAPTWSWASVDAPHGIVYVKVLRTRTKESFREKVDAASAACVLAGPDKTGAVKSGYIVMKTSLCPVYLRRICRNCKASRSRISYTVEYDRWTSTRSHSIQPCVPNGIQGLDIGSAFLSFFADFKYEISDFEYLDTGKDMKCKHSRAFLLHLYDVESSGSAVITDFFLVLKKGQHLGLHQFERIAVISIEFKNWTERELWFKNVYLKVSENETMVTLV